MIARKTVLRFGILCCCAPLALLLQACSFYSFKEESVETETLKNIPSGYSMAIMPIVNNSKKAGMDEALRHELYRSLSPLEYQDVELEKINEAVSDAASQMKVRWDRVPPAAFRDGRLADSLLYADIEKVSKFLLPLYSHIMMRVKVIWYDTKSGQTIYSDVATIHNRRITIPTSLGGIGESLFMVVWHLRDTEVKATVEEFGKRLAQEFPAHLSSEGKPVGIDEIRVAAPSAVLKPGDVLQVEALGTQGQTCTFEISNDVKDLPMQEERSQAGLYKGSYTIQAGDTCEAGVVRVHIKSAWGATDTKSKMDAGFRIEAGEPRTPGKTAAELQKTTSTLTAQTTGKKEEPRVPIAEAPKLPASLVKTGKWTYQTSGKDPVSIPWEQVGSAFVPPLRGGDSFRFEFEFSEAAYLYVFRYNTLLSLTQLFPVEGQGPEMQNPVPAGKAVRIPAEASTQGVGFTLEAAPEGLTVKEGILILVSKEPRKDITDLYEAYQGKVGTTESSVLIPELGAFVGAVRKERPGSEAKRIIFVQQEGGAQETAPGK